MDPDKGYTPDRNRDSDYSFTGTLVQAFRRYPSRWPRAYGSQSGDTRSGSAVRAYRAGILSIISAADYLAFIILARGH